MNIAIPLSISERATLEGLLENDIDKTSQLIAKAREYGEREACAVLDGRMARLLTLKSKLGLED